MKKLHTANVHAEISALSAATAREIKDFLEANGARALSRRPTITELSSVTIRDTRSAKSKNVLTFDYVYTAHGLSLHDVRGQVHRLVARATKSETVEHTVELSHRRQLSCDCGCGASAEA